MLIKVKWGKEVYDVDVDLGAPGQVFKAQLQSMTGVPADKMKVMGIKGGQLKDDTDMATTGLSEGKQLMLIGSAEAMKPPPSEPVKFAEDEVKGGHDAQVMMSNGLANLGNTCYLNSAVQMLRVVPQLRAALEGANDNQVANQLGKLYQTLDATREPIPPIAFWTTFMSAFPTFGETDQGRPMQHDSQEALSSLFQSIYGSKSAPDPRLFTGQITQQIYNDIDGKDKSRTETLPFTILPCNIDGEVTTLEMGLEKGMESSFAGQSESGAEATFNRKGRLTSLPEFLTVHLVRMAWRGDTKKKAKILKPITFPMVLDAYTLCDDALKGQMDPARAKVMERRDAELARRRALKMKGAAAENAEAEVKADVEPIEPVIGNDSAFYELAAVVSHKGRDADGGHYVAWVKKNDGWLVYDDANVGPVTEEDVLRLRGVGEAHIAYMLLYRSRDPRTQLAPLPL